MTTNTKNENKYGYDTKYGYYDTQASVKAANEFVRDLMGIQYRAAQVVMEKSMGMGQVWTEYMHSQMNEGMKLSQEYIKQGLTLSETAKNTASEVSERILRNPTTTA